MSKHGIVCIEMTKFGQLNTHLNSESNLALQLNSFPNDNVNSYSHGFEKIYALENVDISSVRKIDLSSLIRPETSIDVRNEDDDGEPLDPQLQFNFGPPAQQLEPFVMRESIKVLGLSKRVETFLISQHKHLLKDLLMEDRSTLAEIKGLGLGHLDELQHKLQDYLKGFSVDKVTRIDFISWLRSLVADIDPKRAYMALEGFNLGDLVTLSTIETAEVRRFSPQKRQELSQETLQQFRVESKLRQVHEDMQKICENFVGPWMEKRLGVATEAELTERLLSMSLAPVQALPILLWLKHVFFDDQFPLQLFLNRVEDVLYACNVTTQKAVNEVVAKAKTYFYKADNHYALPMLTSWIAREFACDWEGFTEGFIEKSLRLSPQFRVRKGDSGELIVKLR